MKCDIGILAVSEPSKLLKGVRFSYVAPFLFLLLTGCESFDPRRAAGFTTFHPSERTEIWSVCQKTQDVHGKEHLHCNKKDLLNFTFKF